MSRAISSRSGSRVIITSITIGVLACRAWSGEPGAGSSEASDIVIGGTVDTLLSHATDSLIQPIAVAVGGDGSVYVLDGERLMVTAWSPSAPRRSFARGGEGPGELRNPGGMDVAGDTVRVYNIGNGRLELFRTDGTSLGGRQLPPAALDGPLAVSRDGRLAAATMGVGDTNLAIVFARGDHHEVMRLGPLLAPQVAQWSLTAIHNAVTAGQVPSMFRNFASPLFGSNGTVWLILFAEGLVQRYDSTGRLLSSLRLDLPEIQQIKADFLEAGRRTKAPTRFGMLTYVPDAKVVGDDLWMLLGMPEENGSVVLVVAGNGLLRHRIVLPGVRGARGLAVDATNRHLYLMIMGEGLLLRAALPPGLH